MAVSGSITKSVNFYLNNLKRLSRADKNRLFNDTCHYLEINNYTAHSLNSAKYQQLVKSIRENLPDVFSGEISCVDGRLPSFITHLPKISRTWKEPGAVAQSSNFEDRLPTRLAIAIKSHFEKFPDKPLIEFVQAHTSLNHQSKHGCGATKLALKGTGVDFKTDGGLAWNLRLLQNTTFKALANQAGKNNKLLFVVFEVLDTDTAGIILGLDRYTSSPISKEKLQKLMEEDKVLATPHIYIKFLTDVDNISKVPPKQFITLLKKADKTYEAALMINTVSKKIQNNLHLSGYLNKQLVKLYPQVNQKVRNIIKHRLMHNLSFGLLSGFFKDPYSNTFNHHHERYISIGEIGIGDEAVSLQAFRVNHTGYKQINDDLTIMLNLMETTAEVAPPFIVFLVEPVAKKLYLKDPFAQTIQRAKTQLAKLRRVILNNPALSAKIREEKFIILPAIVEEKNQEVLEIPMFY